LFKFVNVHCSFSVVSSYGDEVGMSDETSQYQDMQADGLGIFYVAPRILFTIY
jgi:hypothetical protein